ncbi:MAG: uroporphyrinogen decarboxylase family protein [Deltaproteobacteria bacterium]|nr:uroporphyrinogen decarboxylase family protein [Deltaproteobacteria bacterium]MBW1942428.1 uroporphyrinogen decarboxylase family protein [Deltaproteobacteria bacterium]
MNSYERVMAVIKGELPDRVPVIPAAREWCIRQAGFTFAEVLESPEKYVFSQYYCVKKYKYDAVWDLFAIHAESEALGSRIQISRDIPPSIIEPIIQDYGKDLGRLRLPNPYKDGRLPQMLTIIRRLKELCEGDIPVLGYCQAPFRHAAMLRGLEKALRDTKKAPNQLKELLEISLTGLVHWGIAVAEAGADIICISDPTVSQDVMSRDTWLEFGFPYLKRLVNALKKTGKPLKLHVCGDTTDRLETFVEAGFDILSLDTKVDFEQARKKVGDKVCLFGNVCPNTTLLFGSPQDVENDSKKVIRQAGLSGRFILSSGCMLSPDTPGENVHAMVEAAETHGRYPINN